MAEDEFLRGIAALILYAAAFNIPCDDKALQMVYREALHDVPGDLFIAAVRAILDDWTDDYRLPVPAIIRGKVREDMRLRQLHLARLSHVEPTLDTPTEPPMSAEELAAWNDKIAAMPIGPLRASLERCAKAVAERQLANTNAPE